MQQVYITKSLCNIVTFETKCKELDEYQWLQSLTTKPKLKTYIVYKQTFGIEKYVKYCNVYTEFRNPMYTKINNIEFIDMTDKEKIISLMKYHWKDVSQYIELARDKRTNIIYNSV